MDEGTIKQLRCDSLFNAMNATGTMSDPSTHYRLKTGTLFPTAQSLEIIYMADGLIQRIVDMYADEAVKAGITITDEKGNGADVLEKLKDLDAESVFADALRWRNLQGGGAVLMRIDDGRRWDEPLDLSNIKEVECLRSLDMTDITKTPGGTYKEVWKPEYGQQEFYDVLPENEGGTPFRVHESRVLTFVGDKLPRHSRMQHNWQWGKSMAATVYEAVLNFNRANNAGLNALERISQLVVGIPCLSETLATDGGERQVAKRLDTIDMSRSIFNSIVTDVSEQVQLLNAQLTRVPEVMAHIWQVVATVTGIPVTKLFGQAPAGFKSSDDSGMENWYSEIGKLQRRVTAKPWERLIKIIYLSKNGPTKGIEPDWSMTFNPLWLPSQKEQAETYKLEAEADEKYMTNQVIYPDEVRAKLRDKGIKLMDDDEFDNIVLPDEE